MKTVLAPIDFSLVSDQVVTEAIALARVTGARLVLLHVVSPLPVLGGAVALKVTEKQFAAEAKKGAVRKLARLQRSLRANGVTAQVVHLSGDPGECIVEQAHQLSADYIVMGARRPGATGEAAVGRSANCVLKRAACPVVILPAGAGQSRRTRARRAKSAEVLDV